MKKLTILLAAFLFTAGMAFAQNNDATVDQTGNDNQATATQSGSDNDAEIEQVGNDNDGTITQNNLNNSGTILQTGDNNTATSDQDGEKNDGFILQGWDDKSVTDGNEVSLTQSGYANRSDVFQFYGEDNEATVTQSGQENDARVMQGWFVPFDAVNRNVASIDQQSSNNDSRIFQYNGDDNEAIVNQSIGDYNNGQISQGYLWNVHDVQISEANFNYGRIDQLGGDNNATVMQLGDHNSFELVQNGSGNVVGEEGRVSQGAKWFIQDGDDNDFVGEQNNGSILDYDSEGISGYYGSFQEGNYNKIDLIQGQDDYGLIQQLGDSNTATLFQAGNIGHEATILQNGNSNTAHVTQTN